MDDTLKMHEKTAEWLEKEMIKHIRNFQLSKTEKEREKSKKHLQEIQSRLFIEAKELRRLLGL